MSVEYAEFVRNDCTDSSEWANVRQISNRLLVALNHPPTFDRISKANQPEGRSKVVQDAFIEAALEMGFKSEVKGLFKDTCPGLRPDYFLNLGSTGILLEVERGKTVTNNMDILDFWKCHICEHAHYLFLLVPILLKHNHKRSATKAFQSVTRRMAPFFMPRNYTTVRGLVVFGY